MPNDPERDLTVRGDSVEQIYRTYRERRYLVNRRYQRKLVWTLDEKQRFIDSISRGLPVPIILLAEAKRQGSSLFEIIDGMQRLNAIASFLENAYALPTPDGPRYFDLNTMASSKQLLDSGELTQNQPALGRDLCVAIASYTVPLSVYEATNDEQVDEVFRRINSGGRQLSRQELRMAGSLGTFTTAVRVTASRVRGDSSASDELRLNDMATISLSGRELGYGIPLDDVFWVKHGILTKEQVRESQDEQLIGDMLAYVLTSPKPASRSEFLDDYFGLGSSESSEKRYNDVNIEVQKRSLEIAVIDFQRVFDALIEVLDHHGASFGDLLFGDSAPQRAPRYFQVVFLALHQLVVERNLRIGSVEGVVEALRNASRSITIQEGGRWGADNREKNVNSVVGLLQSSFTDEGVENAATARWITLLENLLTNSMVEQPSYDFKQGFHRLDGECVVDDVSVEKAFKTLVGIANIGPGTTGFVIVGVTDSEADARRVQELHQVEPRVYRGFSIVGIGHEARVAGRSLDEHYQWLSEKVRASPISEPLRGYVGSHLKLVRYFEKDVLVLEAKAQSGPTHYDGHYYDRSGSQLVEILPADLAGLFSRFA